jgi:DNA-binding CsgD family transcriptional regulator
VSADSSLTEQPDTGVLERQLVELLALEREIVELEHVRRADALERVRDAIRRLGELGSPQRILDRAAEELGSTAQFDRVLISEVIGRQLHPRALWSSRENSVTPDALPVIELKYPLIEHETVDRQAVELVRVDALGPRAGGELRLALGWESYVVAALTVQGDTLGLVHADATASARALDALDAEVVGNFTEGLAGAFERATLRATLRRHRDELQSAIRWMSGRLGGLSDDLAPPPAGADPQLVDALTPRELEVLQLLAQGRTNQAIAATLVVREGTVKYHVKNILRKLGATSRADAVARYARALGSLEQQ